MWYAFFLIYNNLGVFRMHVKKHLSFSVLRKQMSGRLYQIEDSRQQSKVEYSIHDCAMSGFAMMYFQDPSLLEFQRRMAEHGNLNNLGNMFGVEAIPKDTQLRDVLDELPCEALEPIFLDYFKQLQRGKHLEAYRFLDGKYLVTLDGSEYFSSEKIQCSGCLRKSKSGQTRYHHMILQAAIVHPERKQVIVLAPEAVRNEDGSKKQDCEINAGKRIINKIRTAHPKLPMVILGDGLYSKQPFIEDCKKRSLHFILVAKPKDHTVLMEWIEEQKQMGELSSLEYNDFKGRRHQYEWINNMPLNGKKHLSMNFFLLNILAFFMHQIFEVTDLLYQTCRAKFSSRKEFWNQLRCTFRILIFPNWETLLQIIISPPRPP